MPTNPTPTTAVALVRYVLSMGIKCMLLSMGTKCMILSMGTKCMILNMDTKCMIVSIGTKCMMFPKPPSNRLQTPQRSAYSHIPGGEFVAYKHCQIF